ncbi:MAG: DUF4136 domain-containing protein [Anditalea sp.]
MKILMRLFLLCLVTSFLVGCASQRSMNVGSDQRTDANISDFQTYNWVSDIGEMPSSQVFIGSEGVLIFNQESTRNSIKEAIGTQLEAKGFTQDANNPDMLVNYMVLEQADQLRTYTREGNSYLGEGPVEKDVEMVDVEPGTVLVNFINADSGLQVWQGFASGALEESDVENEKNLQSKIAAIFDQFDFSAFSVNTTQVPR